MATAGLALCSKLTVNLPCAVDAATLQMNLLYALLQRPVTLHSWRLATIEPRVVTAARDAQQTTHHTDRVVATTAVDTLVSHFDSLAKYRAASFKKSRSSLT